MTKLLEDNELKILKDVVKLPTAPFREELVQEYALHFAREHGLGARSDRFGNILLEYRPAAPPQNATLPALCFTAHMDHPGFEVLAFNEARNEGEAEFRGGIRSEFWPGCSLQIYSFEQGSWIEAEGITSLPPRDPERKSFQRFHFSLSKGKVEPGAIGTFDVPFCQVRGEQLHTKSADDPAQVALVLAWLAQLKREKVPVHAMGLLTRAEEVGFVGASGALESGLMPEEEVPVIVLECSKALPGLAEIGKGPVLRVGDAGTVYDPDVDAWMLGAAKKLWTKERGGDPEAPPDVERLKRNETGEEFKYQRALMTGGVCEAGLFTLVRRRVGALALPLGNYHNIGEGSKPQPAPEIISLADCAHQLRLMTTLASEPFTGMKDGPLRGRLQGVYEQHVERLAGNEYAKAHVDARPG